MNRYRTKEAKKQAETIFRLRQQGKTYQEIAAQAGLSYQNTVQKYHKECLFREQAFYYPFIEYISARTEKAIRRSMGEELLEQPENLNNPETIGTLFKWPGVNNGVLNDLAEGFTAAGYESFDPEKIIENLFNRKNRAYRSID